MESAELPHVQSLKATHLRAFFVSIQERYATKTLHGIAVDIKAFFNFLLGEEYLSANPMQRVAMPRLDQTVLPAFTPDEVSAMMTQTKGRDPVSFRDRAILVVLLDSGVRLSELVSMKVGDVDLSTGTFKVVGKGRKERICRLGPTALKSFIRYVRVRRGKPSEPLWIGKYGPITNSGVSQILRQIGQSCAVHAHPHKFRRTCALTLLRAGCDVFSVQHILGHSDLTVLRRYLAQTEQDVLAAHTKFSPVDRLA